MTLDIAFYAQRLPFVLSPSPDHPEYDYLRESNGRWDAIIELAKERGHRLRAMIDEPLPQDFPDLENGGVVVFRCNPNWYPQARRTLLEREKSHRPLSAIWHSEPLPPPPGSRLPRRRMYRYELELILRRDPRASDTFTNAFCMRGLAKHNVPDLLIGSSTDRCEYFTSRKWRSHRVPYGHRSLMEEAPPPNDQSAERDIDVLFVGSHKMPHRLRVIEQLRKQGVNVTVMGDWHNQGMWANERDAIVRRAKIFLGLQRYPSTLAGLRFLIGMTNRCMIISEPLYKPDPYQPGVHFVSALPEEMASTIRRYLEDHEARGRISEAGYQLSQSMTPRDSSARVLDLIEARMKEVRQSQVRGAAFIAAR